MKRIVAYLLITAMSIVLSIPAFAQQKKKAAGKTNNELQKIESLKKDYLSHQLNLSPKESKKFWPAYNQYEKKVHQINRARRQTHMNKKELNKASDQQIKKSLNNDFNLQQQVLQTRKSYRDKFMQILPPKKVMKLYKSERDFNTKLIKELKRRSDDEQKESKPKGKGPGQQH